MISAFNQDENDVTIKENDLYYKIWKKTIGSEGFT